MSKQTRIALANYKQHIVCPLFSLIGIYNIVETLTMAYATASYNNVGKYTVRIKNV